MDVIFDKYTSNARNLYEIDTLLARLAVDTFSEAEAILGGPGDLSETAREDSESSEPK